MSSSIVRLDTIMLDYYFNALSLWRASQLLSAPTHSLTYSSNDYLDSK